MMLTFSCVLLAFSFTASLYYKRYRYRSELIYRTLSISPVVEYLIKMLDLDRIETQFLNDLYNEIKLNQEGEYFTYSIDSSEVCIIFKGVHIPLNIKEQDLIRKAHGGNYKRGVSREFNAKSLELASLLEAHLSNLS